MTVQSRFKPVWAAALVLLAGCAAATPERVIRNEGPGAGAGRSLCQRVADDFGMVVTGGDPAGGVEYSASQVETAIAGRGVTYAINLVRNSRPEACSNTSSGVVCTVVGPAELEIRSNRGWARYSVARGDGGVLATRGARLMCRATPS